MLQQPTTALIGTTITNTNFLLYLSNQFRNERERFQSVKCISKKSGISMLLQALIAQKYTPVCFSAIVIKLLLCCIVNYSLQ
jgi:hypothetical protein